MRLLEPGESGLQNLATLLVGQRLVLRVFDFHLELADSVHQAQLIFEQGEIFGEAVVVHEPVHPESLFGQDNDARLVLIWVMRIEDLVRCVPIFVLLSDEFCLEHFCQRSHNNQLERHQLI